MTAKRGQARDPHAWGLSAGEYRALGWPKSGHGSFMKLEFLYQGFAVHRDNLDIDSEVARRRFAAAVARKLPDLVDDLREKVEQDLWELVSKVEAVEPRYEETEQSGGSTADRLVELVSDVEFFHDSESNTYATIPVDDHKQTCRIHSTGFRNWLRGRYYKECKKAPNSQALQDALGVLDSKALFDGQAHEVHVRIAEHDGAIYLDLGRKPWEAVRIDGTGWRVVRDVPVKFVRPKGLLALPTPVSGGFIRELRRFVNIDDDEQWTLFQACVVSMFRPNRPFVVVVITGEQGTAKSTAERVMRALVDPNAAPLRSMPKSEHDLVIAAKNGWALAFDNLSWLPPWFSDALCRIATGGGFGTRSLYTDAEESLFAGMRPVLLNGIADLATRGDLLDRTVLLCLSPIDRKKRQAERQFWAEFEEARPRILGALLDAVSSGVKNLPDVRIDELPRMADFAMFGAAAEPALDCGVGNFLAAYTQACHTVIQDALDASPLTPVIRSFFADYSEPWDGTATELLQLLNERAGEKQKERAWPKNASSLSGKLTRLAPSLRAIGIEVMIYRSSGSDSRKRISLRRPPEPRAGESDPRDHPDEDGDEYRECFE